MADEAKNDEATSKLMAMMTDLHRKMDNQGKAIQDIKDTLTTEIESVKSRLDRIERPPFDPERTLVFTGIKPNGSTSDLSKIQCLLEMTGEEFNVVNVKRLATQSERGIGLIKCELQSLEEKINILKKKEVMIQAAPGSWIRSSKSHMERIMTMNFQTILKLIPGGDQYRVTGTGKVEEKPNEEYGMEVAEENEGYTTVTGPEKRNRFRRGGPQGQRGAPRGGT